MKHGRDPNDVVFLVLAVAGSVLLGMVVPSLSGDPHSAESGQSTAVFESARQDEQKKTASESARQDEQKKTASESASQDEQKKTLSASVPKTEATPIGEWKGAQDFDPPPGDGEEHSEEVPFAVDSDPTTTWSTERYSGGLATVGKDGVGLAVDAGRAVKASELELETETPGWSGEVYAADQQARDLAGWGEPVGSISKASEDETVPLELRKPARYYLVWITDLGNGDTVELSEIS